MKTNMFLGVLLTIFSIACSQDQLTPDVTASSAKEVGSGTGGGTTTCSPITSYVVKSDYRAGETGLSSVDIAYSVKPCTTGQALRVQIELIKFDTKAVIDVVDNMPLNGKYHYQSTGMYGVYSTKMTVFDANTNAVVQTTSFSVALVPKKI